MKKILTLSIALVLVAAIVSVAKSADIDTNVQAGTAYPKDRHIVRSSDGTIVVLYLKSHNIVAKKSTDDGATWTNLAGGAGSTLIADHADDNFSICIDEDDNIYVAYEESIHIYFMKLTYSAGIWQKGEPIEVDGPWTKYPSIIRENSGRIWITYGAGPSADHLRATYSDDEFGTERIVTEVSLLGGGADWDEFCPAIVIRNGKPFIVYQNLHLSRMMWSEWDPVGEEWSTPSQISNDWVYRRDFSVTSVGTTVHLVYTSEKLRYTYYDGTWRTPEDLTESSGYINPSLTANNTTNLDLWCFASIRYDDDPWGPYYNIEYKRRTGSTWDSSWTAITTGDAENLFPTTPSISTPYVPLAWTDRAPTYTVRFDSSVYTGGPEAPQNVDDGVDGWSSDNTPTFTWDSVDGAVGYYYLAAPLALWTWTIAPPATTAPLSDGTHTFYVKAQYGTGFTGPAGSHDCQIDTTPPSGTISINDNAQYTNSTLVTLTLSASDSGSGVSKMRFRNEGGSLSSEEDYATSKSWTLTAGEGTKRVYVQYKDNTGNWSDPISDTIILDTIPPTGTISINDNAQYTNSTLVTLSLWASDSGSGVSKMRFRNEGGSLSSEENYAPSKSSWTLTGGEGTKTVYVQYKDNAGNWSGLTSISDTIILAPYITSISPNYGINTERVQVTITGDNFSDADEMKLVRTGFPDINSQNLVVTARDSIQCVFDLSNRAYGLWDVVVKNNIGQLYSMPEGFSVCLPLIYDAHGGVAAGSDGKTMIAVSPHTFGEDVYIVIDSNYTSTEITAANQLDDLDINTVRINTGIIKFMPYSVLSEAIDRDLGKEVTITLPYDMNGNGIVYNTPPLIKERHLKIGELVDARWRAIGDSVVDSNNDTVSGKVNHLSAYALLGISQLGVNLSGAHPYPVPFRANRNEKIIFTGLPGNVEIKIYDIAGDLVTTLKEQDMDGEFEWNVTNDSGDKVCSGVYIYLMKDEQGEKKTGRLVIIR